MHRPWRCLCFWNKKKHSSVRQRIERWAKRPSHRSPGNYFYFTLYFCFFIGNYRNMDRYVFQVYHCGCGGSDHRTEYKFKLRLFKNQRSCHPWWSTLHLYLDFCTWKTILFPGLPSFSLCPSCFFSYSTTDSSDFKNLPRQRNYIKWSSPDHLTLLLLMRFP